MAGLLTSTRVLFCFDGATQALPSVLFYFFFHVLFSLVLSLAPFFFFLIFFLVFFCHRFGQLGGAFLAVAQQIDVTAARIRPLELNAPNGSALPFYL